jgi:ribonuclease HII
VVAGVDEVGRGSWAGPVTAAAVVLPRGIRLPGVQDSKKLSLPDRQRLARLIKRRAVAVGLGWSSHLEVDRFGLTWAVRQSGLRALAGLRLQYQAVLLDGNHNYLKDHCRAEAVIRADDRCLSVAAASIVAKTARDSFMRYQHRLFPQFGFDTNVGYGTRAHRLAVAQGLSPLHRRLFKPVMLAQTAAEQMQFMELIGADVD